VLNFYRANSILCGMGAVADYESSYGVESIVGPGLRHWVRQLGSWTGIATLLPTSAGEDIQRLMVYFHNEAAHVTLSFADEYIHVHWYADVPKDAARQQVMNQVLVAFQTYSWQKLLTSQQGVVPFSVEMQVWLQLDWRPRAVAAGYRYCALVQPHDLASQMSLVDILREHIVSWPCYYCCPSEQEAQVWLVAQPRVA
jgi:hypothetical protein